MTPPDDVYTHGHHESVLRSHQWRTAENSAGYLLDVLRPARVVLDVGLRPGHDHGRHRGRVAPGRVDRPRPQPRKSLDLARAEAARRGVDNVEFVVGDVYALDLPDASFDVVHAHQVLQHLTDPVAALREMRRVCTPGGVVAARDSDYAAFTWCPDDPRLDAVARALPRRSRAANGAEPDAGRRLLAWARAAGFSDVDGDRVGAGASPRPRTGPGGAACGRTASSTSAFAEQAIDGGLATPAELEDIAAAWRAWSESPDAWFGILHGELRATAR